jgi:YcxB-like protein
MEIRYTPTSEDSLNALRASPRPAWALSLFVLLLSLMFVVGIYLIDHDLTAIGWVWLAASVALGIAVYEAPRIQTRRALKTTPSAQGEIAITFADAGTMATYPTGKSELEWRAYTRYKETEHGFLLFLSSYRSIFIPKRVMSPEQVRELRSLLSSHLRKPELR